MLYHVQIVKFFTSIYDHIFRIRKAEKLTNVWKTSILLLLSSAILYGFMAYLGIGSSMLSVGMTELGTAEYETSKLWFVFGRVLYGVIFAAAILFLPGLLFYLVTEIPYQKLLVMQQAVLIVMLVERLLWIPLVLFIGLDWYVSPLSLGIIVSYLTSIDWLIYFFGAITLFNLWIIWFQFRFLHTLSEVRPRILWLFILLLHLLGWLLAATIALADSSIISRWFG